MTNEQLAILFEAMADLIDQLAEDVGDLIEEGERVKERKWIGPGPRPMFEAVMWTVSDMDSKEKLWALVDTDEFKAVLLIKKFANRIRDNPRFLEEQADNKEQVDNGE